MPEKRFSHVLVDIVGPLPSSYGYKFLLTAVDRTSRLVHAMPLKEATASETATAFLHHWIPWLGTPSVVTSDNGASFTAGLWKGMMDRLNVEVKYSALYRQESIGMLERQHRDLKNSLNWEELSCCFSHLRTTKTTLETVKFRSLLSFLDRHLNF